MSGKKGPAGSKTDILVVEDSLTEAETLRFLLEQKGYRITLARDGRNAMTYLNGYRPALIISDILMPEMDGYELCRRIKTDVQTRAIGVILLTSLYEAADVLQGLVCGADSFISKPYATDYLLMQIENTLSGLPVTAKEGILVELEIPMAGKPQLFRADPQRIVSLTLSIYEAAIRRNTELLQSQDELRALNETLEDQVEQRTAALSAEIVKREHLQDELRSMSLHDELTGLLNRRGFMALAEHHWHLAVRTRQRFALLYMDMDDLKGINDSLGHGAGDQALQTVARGIEKTFRESDIMGRLGGDEFVVLLVDCDSGTAREAICRMEKNLIVEKTHGTGLPPLSLSIGLVNFNPDDKAGINDLLEQADADMYIHKQQFHESRK